MTKDQETEYKTLQTEEKNFYNAFLEYISFLQKQDSYKMGTKTLLPEFYIGEYLEGKRHKSQKPKNVLKDMMLQTTNSGSRVVEQFAGSLVGAEAVIELWKEKKGVRDYFAIEKDKNTFNAGKKFLEENYKDFSFYTYDDIFKDMPNQMIESIDQSKCKKYSELVAIITKINSELSDIIEIELNSKISMLDLNNNLTPENISKTDTPLMTFHMKRNKGVNSQFQIEINSEKKVFEIKNTQGVVIKEINDLNLGLAQTYKTFMR